MVETTGTFRGVSVSPEASREQMGCRLRVWVGRRAGFRPLSQSAGLWYRPHAASEGTGGGTFDETMLFFKPERNKLYLTKK